MTPTTPTERAQRLIDDLAFAAPEMHQTHIVKRFEQAMGEAAAAEREAVALRWRQLHELLPGLSSLLVLDADSAGAVIASRPDVWDVVRAFLADPDQ
jgi:hypothetical protein